MWVIPTGTSSALKKKSGKESQYMFSHTKTGSDPPIGSDRESRRDNYRTDTEVHSDLYSYSLFSVLSYVYLTT